MHILPYTSAVVILSVVSTFLFILLLELNAVHRGVMAIYDFKKQKYWTGPVDNTTWLKIKKQK